MNKLIASKEQSLRDLVAHQKIIKRTHEITHSEKTRAILDFIAIRIAITESEIKKLKAVPVLMLLLLISACAAPGSIKKEDVISQYTEMTCVALYGNEPGDCDSNYL